MKHTSQKTLKANNIKALLVNGNIKEAVKYAKEKGITQQEFGKISKKRSGNGYVFNALRTYPQGLSEHRTNTAMN